jgi:hypothetical protein
MVAVTKGIAKKQAQELTKAQEDKDMDNRLKEAMRSVQNDVSESEVSTKKYLDGSFQLRAQIRTELSKAVTEALMLTHHPLSSEDSEYISETVRGLSYALSGKVQEGACIARLASGEYLEYKKNA